MGIGIIFARLCGIACCSVVIPKKPMLKRRSVRQFAPLRTQAWRLAGGDLCTAVMNAARATVRRGSHLSRLIIVTSAAN
jgi:hypothetical protein